MSYLVLARKWRPKRFDDVVGQSHVLRALTHALDNDRMHHAYLFAGTRGVGKTTLARILAKALNCERGVSSQPCGECSACVEIDEGRFVDLIEVDAASRTKVDDTRELLDNVQYRPTRGRSKVYLIDEVHMLSTHSFNALLKTLEEPPPYVTFLLATTDPQKLPVTVLSRCLQFNLKRLTPELIAERLAHIAEHEQVESEPAALQLIARSAEGSMRDALSITDQAIAFGAGALTSPAVASMLGALDRSAVVGLLERLGAGDADGALALIDEADAQFPDYRRLLDELSLLLTRIAIHQATGATDADAEDAAAIKALSAQLPAEDVQLFYQTTLIAKRDLDLAPDPRSGIEMALLRMLAFRPPRAGGAGEAGAPAPGGAGPSAAREALRQTVGATRRASSRAAASPSSPRDDEPGAAAAQAEPAAGEPTALPDWHRLIGQLSLGGAARLLAANCAFSTRDGDSVKLALDRRFESLLSAARVAEIGEALSRHLGETVTVRIDIDGESAEETPTQKASREAQEHEARTRAGLERDSAIDAMKSMFDATLQDGASSAPPRSE